MIELIGKYNSCKIYATTLDNNVISQIYGMLNYEAFKGEKIRIMPDTHAGKGSVVGFTSTITDKVIPMVVGVDIGCGVDVVKLDEKSIDFKKLDEVIYNYVPSGFDLRDRPHKFYKKTRLDKLKCKREVSLDIASLGIGSLGGGNHYIEIDQDAKGHLYLVVHSGSRYLGGKVAQTYQDIAYRTMNFDYKMGIINRLKAEGKDQDIQNVLKSVKMTHIEKELAYLYGENMENYLHDMDIVQEYAVYNRKAIIDEIVRKMELTVVDEFTTIHNYIDTKNRILRKGSISAQNGEKVIIPINMRDGAIIGIGKGNADWNYSAPHGAGRLFSRSEASQIITLEEFQQSMEGIYSSSVTETTIDESPMAYKSLEEILEHVTETIDVVEVIKPVYNFKSHKKPVWTK
jgi:Uncharacterized conserved protein